MYKSFGRVVFFFVSKIVRDDNKTEAYEETAAYLLTIAQLGMIIFPLYIIADVMESNMENAYWILLIPSVLLVFRNSKKYEGSFTKTPIHRTNLKDVILFCCVILTLAILLVIRLVQVRYT